MIGHHLERELVVVPQKHRPLTGLGDLGRLSEDVGDRVPVLLGECTIPPRPQRKVNEQVALVTAADISVGILR
ncbi:hypothetical protein, partial [Thiohalocapsa sp.]|uniref:hypothetical protein n=1 Tax=Thiohalocapsa sp. TaxID=2497641 RepID=UPI0025DD5A7F